MANILNNNYAGSLTPGISSLLSVGSNDTALWNVAMTNGSKVRFSYAQSSAPLQLISDNSGNGVGLCGLLTNGQNTLNFMNLDLVAVGGVTVECRDAFYQTDYANAFNGVLSQEVDDELINTFATDLIKDFSLKAQNLRWSGDVTSADTNLNVQDGVVVKIQAKGAFDAVTNPNGYQQLPSTPVTATNVIDELKAVINALPTYVTSAPGFKVIVGPVVSAALRSAAMVQVGVNNMTLTGRDEATGRLTDNFFGYSVYEARGLGAVAANSNIIMAGNFEDTPRGVIKAGFNTPNDEKTIEIVDLENRNIRFTVATGQAVDVLPNLSEVAMNA